MLSHQAVMLDEAIQALAIVPDGIYVDGTFGRGGHSQAILNQLGEHGRLIALDKDPTAIQYARTHFSADSRFQAVKSSFADISSVMLELGIHGAVNGVLLDLGVSSPQLDDPERGFSFMREGPLDMRMDTSQSLTAEIFVNEASAEEMVKIFREYGEERFAKRIANAIVTSRQESPIRTTAALSEIVKQANPRWEKHKHPATRVFQAIRIHINQELNDLVNGLKGCVATLGKGGRLAVITFHSLEDRMVKHFIRDQENDSQIPVGVPVRDVEIKKHFKRIGKAIKPSKDEIAHNVRARSAILRIGEKIS